MAFVIILVMALVGSFHPIVMIAFSGVALIVTVIMLNLVTVTNGTIIALIIVGGIIIIKSSKQ